MRFPFQTIAHTLSSPLFRNHFLFYFNDLLQSSLIDSNFPLSLFPRTLATLFLRCHSSFRLSLRCHLDPSSTLTLPEPFLLRPLPFPPFLAHTRSMSSPGDGFSDDQKCTCKLSPKSCGNTGKKSMGLLLDLHASSGESHRNIANHQLHTPISYPFRLEISQGFCWSQFCCCSSGHK